MYKLNFNHLYYFLTIAEEGTIVKASKKLHMTQPALSHQLKLLEMDLDKKLFERVGRRLVLNEDGQAVRSYANKIFRQSEEMMQFLKSNKPAILKIIKIGVVPWIPEQHILNFIKPQLYSQHIKIEVIQKDLDTLIKDVQNDQLDIILCDSPYAGRSQKLQGHRILTEPLVCVASKALPKKNSFPKNLNGKKVINYWSRCMMADKIDNFLRTNKIEIQTIGGFTNISLMQLAIEKGTAIGFLPLSCAKESIKLKKIVKLGTLEKMKFSLWAITKKSYKDDGIISQLLEKAKDN